MSPEQEVLSNLVAGLLLAALSGLAVRQRMTVCRAFSLYLVVALAANRLMTWWPEHFYTRSFYATVEVVYLTLKLVIVAELTSAALAAFPAARRIARAAFLLVASVTMVSIMMTGTLMDAIQRAQTGAAWGFLVLMAIVWWFHLPLHVLHRMIILGFALYLWAYGSVLALSNSLGPAVSRFLLEIDPMAYAATVAVWVIGGWRANESSLHQGREGRVHTWMLP